jgi:hypothetical protein
MDNSERKRVKVIMIIPPTPKGEFFILKYLKIHNKNATTNK